MRNRKKILFPVTRREMEITAGRSLYIPGHLACEAYEVDVVTNDSRVMQVLDGLYTGHPHIRISPVSGRKETWSKEDRDHRVKQFIRSEPDWCLTGTDLKVWELLALDDLRWNIQPLRYDFRWESHDLVMMALPSRQHLPLVENDVFLTHLLFGAEKNRAPVIGLQIYPASETPLFFASLCSRIVVAKKEHEAFLTGTFGEKVFRLDDLKQGYCLSTIEDRFLNPLLTSPLSLPKETLQVLVVNHGVNRLQIREILQTLGELPFPVHLHFRLVNYGVQDVSERELFDSLFLPLIRDRMKVSLSNQGDLVEALVCCDVMISTNEIVPLEYAPKYGKTGLVYDSLGSWESSNESPFCVRNRGDLARLLVRACEEKQKKRSFQDLLSEVCA